MNIRNRSARLTNEEGFHDAWATAESFDQIDVLQLNEAITAPEMRHIAARLGDLHNKRVADLGCGLGEASVYFALKGANVTSFDLSDKMLQFTQQLARQYDVSLNTCKTTAELMEFAPEEPFDIIYAGNLLHHVDIDATLTSIVRLLKEDGVFVSWDPIAYNPVINLYRRIARQVRTPDEHPLRLQDIRRFRKYFQTVETTYFWFTTLVIFMIMAGIQLRNPNRERFWKVVVKESERWAGIYMPLAKLDTWLLKRCPFLKMLCWNVVILAKNPIEKSAIEI